MFLLFRLVRRHWLPRMVLALLGLFSALMCLMSVATFLSGGAKAWAPDDGVAFSGMFVVLAAIIVLLGRVEKWPYAKTRAGEAARMRDAVDPPRPRSFVVDLIGYLVVGAILLVLLVVLIAFAIFMAG